MKAAGNGRTEGVTSPGPILAATGDGRTGMGGVKPFDVPKKEIWEAFKRVRANGGAAGVDGESIAEFEADLTGNLYKLWNRLSSGSYSPPPVRRVDIPKPDGGTPRRARRSSRGRPLISRSMANSASMRLTASRAIGPFLNSASSKNLRRACAQHAASVAAPITRPGSYSCPKPE